MPDARNPVEVFYSYAHADRRWVKQLDTHLSSLKRQGLISAWQDRQIVAGMDWAREIDTHLNSAAVILLLISPDFLASDYCYGIEMQRALERDQAKEARVIPILLRPVDWKGAPFAHLQALPLDAKPITTWRNKDSAFADVAAGIRRAIEDRSLITISTSHTTLWNVPLARNPFFLGREDLLTQLHMQLQRNQSAALSQKQALSGLGGIGKTQLAVEYAYRYRERYQAVLWVRAESTDTLNASYSELATLLNLPEHQAQEQEVIVQAVRRWLQTQKGWLLLLDNADEPELLTLFLPQTMGGQVVLTTRASALRRFGIASPLTIETFAPEQGALLLLRRAGVLASDAPLERAHAHDRMLSLQLAQELGGLPLALDQAGAYLEATGTSLSTYQQIYQQHRAELLSERRGSEHDHPDPVATTWLLSMQRVEEKNPAAADLLRFCAFLASDPIGEEIVSEGATHLGPILAPVAADGYLLGQAIETLRAYSLIERDPVLATLAVHRLVQEVVRAALPTDVQHAWMERVILAVNATFPRVEVESWPTCERLLPHALVCAKWVEQAAIATPPAARLLNRTAFYVQERARYDEAEVLYKRALAIRERMQGAEHPETATSLNNLAGLYADQGEYEAAEPLYERALTIRERVQGAEHPETATSLNNLAGLYADQGKYEAAEPLYERALAISERVLGAEHPDTATSLNNLALLYKRQGKYEAAEPLYERALAIRERVQGAEHPDTATSLNNLAGLYADQGKYEAAEPLYERALAIRERVLGAEHPSTASSLNNLALLYAAQGKYEAAEPLYERALAISERVQGAEHPSTASSLNNLALLYADQGEYEVAEPLYERALAISERMQGAEHPDTATSLNNLAGLYAAQGKYEAAEPLYERALAISERVQGAEHPETATSLNNLAGLYADQGKYEAAEPLYERALAIRERMLGAEHPDTATSLNNLALLYKRQGKYEAAEPLYERALAIRERVLGAEHPETASSLNNLALLYAAQGKYEAAEPLYERALAIRERVQGAEHPSTATSLNNLAGLYAAQGKYEAAEPLYERALAISERVLGAEHPSTQTIRANAAWRLQQKASGEQT